MPVQITDPSQWLNELTQSQQSLFQLLAPAALGSVVGMTSHVGVPWPDAVGAVVDWQQEGLRRLAALWPAVSSGQVAEPQPDRRFAAEAWQDPRFERLVRGYLATAGQLRDTLESSRLDDRARAQWGFLLRQVLDALSPANCLATNPEALQAALESGGASLRAGMRLFMQDFAKGRVSMTDDSAFEVGRNVAVSPGAVVFENELIQVIQYVPSTSRVHKRPLVIVPPCINKFYILDLQPENSLVAYAVSEGHTVFMLSWRNVGAEQGHLQWDDYLEHGVMQAIDVAQDISRADRVNTLGFCVGGTLLASALAVLAGRGQKKVASVTLLTTMLDFFDTGEIGLMVNAQMVALREATMGGGGVMAGRELAQVFAALRANDLIWPYVVNGYLKGKAPAAFDLLYWNGDDTNLPGPMFCWYLRNAYLENKLRIPGGTVQCGQSVDFRRIDVPAFLYASREDHIVPWQTAYASSRLLGGDSTFVLGASGHIAGVINPPSKNKRNYWVGDVEAEPQRWLGAAQSVPGSWWPAWSAWLSEFAGTEVGARKSLGNRRFAPIEPAPGRYARAKAR